MQAAAVSDDLEEDAKEPPMPPNLQKLDPPLQSFRDWLDMDQDLIAVAAQASPSQEKSKEPFSEWVNSLSELEKTELLLEIIAGDSAIAIELRARLRQRFAQVAELASGAGDDQRSFSKLRELADRHRSDRKAKEKATAEAERRRYLESLKPKQAQIWETIDALIARKQAKSYEQAIQHLVDLRDLAALEGNSATFQAQIRQMQTTYSNRPGLLKRMRSAQLF